MKFIKDNDILSQSQFGFRENKSTEDTLRRFSERIYEELNSSRNVLSVFIDFSKAFDTVSHDILIRKLDHYGIRGGVKEWFADYLRDRNQVTSYENCKSGNKKLNWVCPKAASSRQSSFYYT